MSARFMYFGLIPPLLFSVSLAASAQSFPARQPGDSDMSCQAVYDEAKVMDDMAAVNAPSANQANTQSASSAVKSITDAAVRDTRSAEVAQFGNLLGRLTSGLGIDSQQQQQIEANKAQTRASALARKQYLTSLFNSKKCKVSALRK